MQLSQVSRAPRLSAAALRQIRLSPAALRRASAAAVGALSLIVVTGAAVRLTQSGLGCPDWPTCNGHRLYAAWRLHPLIEFGNRMVTFVVVAAVGAALVAAWLQARRRRDLVLLAAGSVVGVIAQAVLGGITVLVKLSPPWVMAHFLLSMAVIFNAVVLHHRAGLPAGAVRRRVGPEVRRVSMLLVGLTAAVLGLGTVVTGAGPHSGSAGVGRLGWSARDAAELHSAAVMVLIGVTLATLVLLRPRAPRDVERRARVMLWVMAAQGVVGYVQFFTGVPAALVEIHVIGAVVVWLAVVRFHLSLADRLPVPAAGAAPAPVTVATEAALAPT